MYSGKHCFIIFRNKGDAADPRMEQQFEKCCGLGTSWASEGLRCEKFSGPVNGISQVEQGLCLETVDICCIREYHRKNCDKGKDKARQGLSCDDNNNGKRTGNGQTDSYQRDCCEGCKLGMMFIIG